MPALRFALAVAAALALAAAGADAAATAKASHILVKDKAKCQEVKKLIDGGALPIFGDDPRSDSGRKVFSAAPLRQGGYIYVVLQGEAHDKLAALASRDAVMRTTLWSMALVAALGLVLRGDAHFKKVLLKAHPGVCGAGGGVY